MASAQKTIEIDAPREKVFEVIADYAKYPEFLPEVKGVVVGDRKDDAVEVTYDVDLKVKRITYTLRHQHHPPGKVRWSFVKGEMMKDNAGTWELEAISPARTKATYTIEVKLGPLVPGFIVKALTEQNLPAMLDAFRKRSEAAAKTA